MLKSWPKGSNVLYIGRPEVDEKGYWSGLVLCVPFTYLTLAIG